jgi:class 3 adenylate cyclase
LHLREVAVALVVFDARSETDPLAGVVHWERALRTAHQRQGDEAVPLTKFLVSARADRGGVPVSKERLDEPIKEYSFAAASIERRQLTIMFWRSRRLDCIVHAARSRGSAGPNRRLHRAVAEVVKRFEGFVARYMGDGILIYFGYPRASEDDAERAARCALTMVDAVSNLKLAEELQARIGIATRAWSS